MESNARDCALRNEDHGRLKTKDACEHLRNFGGFPDKLSFHSVRLSIHSSNGASLHSLPSNRKRFKIDREVVMPYPMNHIYFPITKQSTASLNIYDYQRTFNISFRHTAPVWPQIPAHDSHRSILTSVHLSEYDTAVTDCC